MMRRFTCVSCVACIALLALSGHSWAQNDVSDSTPRIVREANRLDTEIASLADGWNSETLVELAFGLPTHERREQAARRAVHTIDRIRTARVKISRLLRAVDAAGGMDDPIERDALSRALLIESVSLPIMEARMHLFLGLARDDTLGFSPTAPSRDAFETSVTIAGKVESASAWADAERGLIVGVALIALGESDAAQLALDDANDALGEDESLKEPAFGLEGAVRMVRASHAFHQQTDITDAIGAAQRRLRDSTDVPLVHRDALLMRLLIERTQGDTEAEAKALFVSRLDEIARSMLTDPQSEDDAVLRQLARVAQVSDIDVHNTLWSLGPAVGVALAMEQIPSEPARVRTQALTALLDRDRETMGAYAVIVLSALTEALSDCVNDGSCSLDIALNVAQRGVEARPLHDPTRHALERMCTASIEGDQIPSAISWRAMRVLAARSTDSSHADAWRCRAIAKAFESAPAKNATRVVNAMGLAGPFVNDLEFANPSVVEILLYICQRLTFEMNTLERAQLESSPESKRTEMILQLARLAAAVAEKLEGRNIDAGDLALARELRSYAQLVMGDVAHVLELTQVLLSDDFHKNDSMVARVHLRALLANNRFDDAREWFSLPGSDEASGELLTAALLQTLPLWRSGPEITRSLDDAGISQLNNEHQQTLALVMSWAVAHSETWTIPEKALRRGIGWLIAMNHPMAVELAVDLAGQSTSDAAVMYERMVLAAEAKLHDDDVVGAFAILRDIVESMPPESRRERSYWHASARIVEILAQQNEDGARTPTITREILRLQLQPTWGQHPDCINTIERIARSIGLEQAPAPVDKP